MVTTLVTGGLVAFIMIGIFLIIRKGARRYYAPRTYLGTIPEKYVARPSPPSL